MMDIITVEPGEMNALGSCGPRALQASCSLAAANHNVAPDMCIVRPGAWRLKGPQKILGRETPRVELSALQQAPTIKLQLH